MALTRQQQKAMFAKGDRLRIKSSNVLAKVVKVEPTHIRKGRKENVLTVETKAGKKFVGLDTNISGQSAFKKVNN